MLRYNTNQRNAIMQFLVDNRDKHINAEEVQFYLKNNGVSVGKATIYRYFEALVKEGTLRKFPSADGRGACFQLADNLGQCHRHYHFLCDECNELFHIECDLVEQIDKHISDNHKFQINSVKTIFYGICENCNKISKDL